MSVTEADARAEATSADGLAQRWPITAALAEARSKDAARTFTRRMISLLFDQADRGAITLEPWIHRDVAWRQVHELLIGAGRATSRVSREPQPFVLQMGLGNWCVR